MTTYDNTYDNTEPHKSCMKTLDSKWKVRPCDIWSVRDLHRVTLKGSKESVYVPSHQKKIWKEYNLLVEETDEARQSFCTLDDMEEALADIYDPVIVKHEIDRVRGKKHSTYIDSYILAWNAAARMRNVLNQWTLNEDINELVAIACKATSLPISFSRAKDK